MITITIDEISSLIGRKLKKKEILKMVMGGIIEGRKHNRRSRLEYIRSIVDDIKCTIEENASKLKVLEMCFKAIYLLVKTERERERVRAKDAY